MRRWMALLVVAVTSFVVAACGASSATVAIQVHPGTNAVDRPFSITVSRLQAAERVQVALTSTDTRGTVWKSMASFQADGGGQLDLDHGSARGGSYTGVFGMGLMATMTATPTPPPPTTRTTGAPELRDSGSRCSAGGGRWPRRASCGPASPG